MVELRQAKLRFHAVRYLAEDPLPAFRDTEANVQIKSDGLEPEDREYLGWQSSYRVLPDRLQDDFSSDLVPQELNTIVLENDHLRASFLPQLGGRLVSLVRKQDERELLFFNPDIRMRNVGSRYAWFAGGVEWNWGVWGHSTFTSSPLFAARIKGVNGEPALRLYEYERCHGLLGQMDFHLPEDSKVLFVCTRLINTRSTTSPLYYWTNIAVPESPTVRVLSPATTGITSLPPDYRVFSARPLPTVGATGGKDLSYPQNFPFSAEVFFKIKQEQYSWITALEKDGIGLFEASTAVLRGRKIFVWGMHKGGRNWQEYLSSPDTPYIEIQAGVHATQRHMKPIAPAEEKTWTEAFGCLEVEPSEVHNASWDSAIRSADAAVNRQVSRNQLDHWHDTLRGFLDAEPVEILQTGTGWGALEDARMKHRGRNGLPRATPFPASSMGAEQRPWLELLEKGRLPDLAPEDPPPSWMIQQDWVELLESSVHRHGGSWLEWLHLGVAYREALDFEKAELAWRRSIESLPNPIALRSLASILSFRKEWEAAAELLERAFSLRMNSEAMRAGIAANYMDVLRTLGRQAKALEVYNALPKTSQDRDFLRIRRAQVALEMGDSDTVESIIMGGFSTIREGQESLTDLWFGLWELRAVAGDRSRIDDSVRQRVREEHPLPRQIDFRLTDQTPANS